MLRYQFYFAEQPYKILLCSASLLRETSFAFFLTHGEWEMWGSFFESYRSQLIAWEQMYPESALDGLVEVSSCASEPSRENVLIKYSLKQPLNDNDRVRKTKARLSCNDGNYDRKSWLNSSSETVLRTGRLCKQPGKSSTSLSAFHRAIAELKLILIFSLMSLRIICICRWTFFVSFWSQSSFSFVLCPVFRWIFNISRDGRDFRMNSMNALDS